MAAPGVTVVYSFNYRGNPEEWSQKYHFVGDAPSSDADWILLCADFVPLLQPALAEWVTIERIYCYANTDDDSVYTYNLADHGGTVPGTCPLPSGAGLAPGDAAAWVRWKTARVNTHGKPIYLRKYFHGIMLGTENPALIDTLASAYQEALAAFGASVEGASGHWPGIAGPDGVEPGTVTASTFATTRTLHRRGRRPH